MCLSVAGFKLLNSLAEDFKLSNIMKKYKMN